MFGGDNLHVCLHAASLLASQISTSYHFLDSGHSCNGEITAPNLVAKNGPVKAEKPVLKLKGGQPPPPGWSQLRDVVYRGKHDKLKGKLMCPNGEVIEVASWAQLYVAVADYLARSGDLARGNPPFGFTTGGRYAIAREPVHGSGEPFVTSRPLSGGYFLEANNGAYHSLDFTFRLIEKCKGGPNRLDANDFKFNRA